MWGNDLLALNMKGGIPVVEGAKLIRHQADKIAELEEVVDLVAANLVAAVGKNLMKDLTDEEIWELAQPHGDLTWQDCTLDFARAILKKASEK